MIVAATLSTGHNAKPPTVGSGWGLTKRQLGVSEKEQCAPPVSHSPDCRSTGVASMSSNHPDARRAAALRARLVAIAEACASAGVPLPPRHELADITRATLRQIHRQISALQDAGTITTEVRQRRCFVLEVRP